MRQDLTIPPITLDWSSWFSWNDLQRSTAIVARQAGVYEVKDRDGSEEAMRLHIGKAGNKQTLQSRVYSMVHGSSHSTGERILAREVIDNLVVRWATTDRPSATEEELHILYRQQHGGKLPTYDLHT